MDLRLEQGVTVRNVPSSLGDWPYDSYLDFVKAKARFFRRNSEEVTEEDLEDLPDLSFEEMVVESVSMVVEVDKEGETDLPYTINGENAEEYKKIPVSLQEVSWLRLFRWLDYLEQSFCPDEIIETDPVQYRPEYRGQIYMLRADRIIRTYLQIGLTAGEVIEAREIERILDGKMDKDFYGDVEFERELSLLAIMLRRPGESLPHLPLKRRAFINERAKHFSKIPASIVLSVRFFLTSISLAYTTTELPGHYLRAYPNFRNLIRAIQSERPRIIETSSSGSDGSIKQLSGKDGSRG